MTIEFIPSPEQLKALLDTDMNIKWSKSASHGLYCVYIDDDVAEFTASILGIPYIGCDTKNSVNALITVLSQWNDRTLKAEFTSWANQVYNKRPGVRKIT